MLRFYRFFSFTIVVAATLFSAQVTLAVPAQWETVDVTIHPEGGGAVLLVSGQLPESVTLPAQAELAVPAGGELQWIGQILGGAASADPELQHTMRTVGDSDVYTFTLTKSRTAQIEVPVSSAQVFDGTTYTSRVGWTADQNVPSVRLSIRVPAAAQVATGTAGAELLPGDTAYGFFSKTFRDVKAGQRLEVAVTYATALTSTKSTQPAAASPENSLIPVLAILAAVAGGLALFVGVRRKMRPLGASADEDRTSVVAASDDGSDDDDIAVHDEPAKPGMSASAKRGVATVAVIGVLVVLAFVVAGQSSKAKVTGGTVSQVFAPGEACTTAQIPVTLQNGTDSASAAETLFSALRPVTGLKTASFNSDTSTIQVGFCDSETTEATIRAALASTGMVAAASSAPVAP